MFVRIKFDSRVDLSADYRGRIEGTCLTTLELEFSGWRGRTLVFRTDRSIAEVIDSFESEGFLPDEFVSLEFHN